VATYLFIGFICHFCIKYLKNDHILNLNQINRLLLFLFLGLATHHSSNSQTISFKCNNTTLYKNDFLSISITFSKDAKKEYNAYKNYQFPDIADMVKSHTYFYDKDGPDKNHIITQWYEPIKPGTKNVPAITVISKNKTFTNPPFTISVLSELADDPKEPPAEAWIGKTKLQFELPPVEWHLTASTKELYPMQPIHIKGYLLIPIDNTIPFTFINSHEQKELIKKKIKNNNCLIQDQDLSNTFKRDTITKDNVEFLKLTVIDQFLFPQKPGEINIPATEWYVYSYKKGASDDGIVRLPEKILVKDKNISIKVKELPATSSGKIIPVGLFYIKDYLDTKRIHNGQATYLSIVLETNTDPASIGNFEFISSDIELMGQEIISVRVIDDEQWRVRKEFKFQINPLRSGQYLLADAFRYVYFNPLKRQYDTLRPKSVLTVYGDRIIESNAMLTNDEFYNRYNYQTNNTLFKTNHNDLFNYLANLIILIMLVVTAILIIKK
jgi:hypothetical protein